MPQLENIEAIEKKLWSAADNLRANSNYASNEYFMPVMGLIFLRHAYSKYLAVYDDIANSLPTRGGKKRELNKEDFSQRGAIFLRPEAQFDYLVNLPDGEFADKAIIKAMESIENDYDALKGMLPKAEYNQIENDVLQQLLRTLNPKELKTASGDVFGRIYEYFLTQFADQKAHDNGEFFTPISLVSLIANILEPEQGVILDPACGSGGMFVQSAHFVEHMQANPTEKLTFYGMEKNPTTIRLAEMNLAVHGLEGDIKKAITYYEDPHNLAGKADFVMANPPFNVDEVDAGKIKNDERLPFGLPGINKSGKVSNGNYLWISYFYSYLNDKGRAGFVMSSQASSSGRDEATVRRKLIETGDVDIMIAIRSNFFYTRTVPCELWFLNRSKPDEMKDKVLMIDARNIYRKVTRKIYDFSPEQLQNLLAITWLYRGREDRFLSLIARYLEHTLLQAEECLSLVDQDGSTTRLLAAFEMSLQNLCDKIGPFIETLGIDFPGEKEWEELQSESKLFSQDVQTYEQSIKERTLMWVKRDHSNNELHESMNDMKILADLSHGLIHQADQIYKLCRRLIEQCENDLEVKESELWINRDITKGRKGLDTVRQRVVEQLKQVRYFHKQALWLCERFPEAKLRDVEGLVKLVSIQELETNDWSLTPGRYVGVAPEEDDEDFDFEATLRDIHIELEGLNAESSELAKKISRNFEELGI